MLVLSRRPGEEVVIGDDIRLHILEVHEKRVRIGFTASPDVSIRRLEACGPNEATVPQPGVRTDGRLTDAAS